MAGGAAETANLLGDAVVYLAAAVTAVPLFHRLKLGAVLGYLAAGIVIGPSVLGFVSDAESVLQFGEFGIVMLLFVIGLELRPSRLWQLRADILGLGLMQVLLCGLALTGVLLLLTGLSWQAALVVGMPLALSSTALVMQLLEERDEINTPLGEKSFSILLFQDLAIVPMVTIIAAMSRAPAPADAVPGWQTALMTLAAIAGLILAGRLLLAPLFRLIGSIGARESFVVAALFTVLASAWLMASIGASMALGAFIAGVMLADSPYRQELEINVEPFRGLLLGLFFVAVGMSLDLGVVAARWASVLLLVAALMLTKGALIWALARARGMEARAAGCMALLLAQGGEFGFVLFAAAERGLLIDSSASSLFAAVVTVSMMLTPLLVRLMDRLPRRDQQALPEGPRAHALGRVIIVGYGRFGQSVAQMLAARGVHMTLIDTKPAQIELTGRFGVQVYYGDGGRVDVLRAAGAERAQAIIWCADRALDTATIERIRTAFPHVAIAARAFDRRHWIALREADVDVAVRELFDGAVRLGREALRLVGSDDDTIDAIDEEFRRRDTERLALQLASRDLMVGRDMIFRADNPWVTDGMGEIPFVPSSPPREAAEQS